MIDFTKYFNFKNDFYQDNRNPDPKVNEPCIAQYAVNALVIACDIPWKTAVEDLVAEAHRLCVLPDNPQCVQGMLEKHGFVLQPTSFTAASNMDAFCDELNARFENGEVVISTSKFKRSGCNAVAFVPDPNGHYSIHSPRDFRHIPPENVWVRWPDGLDHSPINRRKRRTTKASAVRKEAESHDHFKFTQQNPVGNYTGDCVIRGLASAMGITWHEAVDGLIQCADYTKMIINNDSVFGKYLVEHGYVKKPQLKLNGKAVKGEYFCEVMASQYQHGERIFAFCGRSHVVAVVPTFENGRYVYYIEDSWDSTGRTIGEYWVEDIASRKTAVPVKKPEIRMEACDFAIGQMIHHPKFGSGHINDVLKPGEDAILAVAFDSVGIKKLSARWVHEHCGCAA